MEILKQLAAPFEPAEVDWRLGTMKSDKTKGMALAYIDARTVQDRLDAVCGALWSCEHIASADKRMTCRIGIKIGDEWVWRSDGAGETDVEGEKGSYSDSFKRAAVRWGVGRYLYDLPSPWVDVEPMGKSFRISAGEKAKLDGIVAKALGIPSNAKTSARPAPQADQRQAEPPPVTIEQLIVTGNEAAERGTEETDRFWLARKPAEQAALKPHVKRWVARAREIDALAKTDPALRGAA